MHILFVTITMKPEHREEYMAEMLLNAKGAQQDEPGCLRFDVVVDSEDANTIHLYEVYKDEAAFGEHQASAHFKRMQGCDRRLARRPRGGASGRQRIANRRGVGVAGSRPSTGPSRASGRTERGQGNHKGCPYGIAPPVSRPSGFLPTQE